MRVATQHFNLTIPFSQRDDCLRRLRIENATRPPPDGVRFVERRNGERRGYSCFAVEDEDAGGGAAGEGEEGVSGGYGVRVSRNDADTEIGFGYIYKACEVI